MHRLAVAIVAGVVAAAIAWRLDRGRDAAPAAAPAGPVETPACDGFDWPVGPPDATGYYDAQSFAARDHLGEDWNGVGGLDTDLGDPVFAIAAGVVVGAVDHGDGWGNVVRIVHGCGDAPGQRVESVYAHLDAIEVQRGQLVRRGERIGTIGTAGGRYPAHLHLELRDRPGLPLGAGYSADRTGYLDPSAFIARHRPR